MRIAVDSEFSFDDGYEFVPVCVAVTAEDGEKRTWWMDEMDDFVSYVTEHKSDTWIAHNVETAEGYLWQSLGLRPTKYKWHDTMLMARIVDNKCTVGKRLMFGLADVLERHKIAYRDHEEKKEDQMICVYRPELTTWKAHLEKLESKKAHLLEYCLKDTEHLLELDAELDEDISEDLYEGQILDKAEPLDPSRRSAWFGFLASYLSECGWRGIPLSRERVKKLVGNAPNAISYLQSGFEKKYPGAFHLVGRKLCKNVSKCREYAAEQYGDNPPLTAAGFVSLASKYTKEYENIGGFLWDYHEMDKHCRALASFCKDKREKNWMGGYMEKEGIIRPRIDILSAITGRCGSKPSSGFVFTMGKPFRGLIDPPEGKVLVELDFHSEEIACQAYASGDATMTEMYDHPEVDNDYYTTLAVNVFGASRDERDTYKQIALMSNYGCGAKKLSDVSKKSLEFCEETLEKLHETFSTYWEFVDNAINNAVKYKYIAFSDGFKVKWNRKSPGKVTTLINWPSQGVGALILRKMLFKMWKADIDLVAPVHDAVVFMADEANWKATSDKVAQIMMDASEECLGKAIGVGEPEVTFHGVVNCHSGFSTREQYAEGNFGRKPKKYMKLYNMYTNVSADLRPDTDNLYVDEDFLDENQ